MSVTDMEKLADIYVAEAAIERNDIQIGCIDNAIARLNRDKEKINQGSSHMRQAVNSWVFELMLSMSHRRFCRLMGIRGRL